MTPERWQQVKEVFAQASALDPASRDPYLVRICGDDGELRHEVASLLSAHATAGAILDRPAGDYLPLSALESDEEPWQGRHLGAYQLVECLGRGGMGEVWRARRADAQYEKEVAIKLVRGGYDTAFVLQRFKAERQILATLEHPNIARLLDAGVTELGQPYLVMELVEGMPIDEYCEKRALAIDERLRLFRAVCAAVSYAHQRLVVHRDLKPGNILVTADGTIKLLDFGIAKLLQPTAVDGAATDATRTSLRALTPAFCSPEQVLGLAITTSSDVYSLGVVLFHLLTGRSPYRSALVSTHDAIRDVCETEPLRPSAAAELALRAGGPRSLPGRELDDITLRALRKEPDRRYGSVEQVSEDVRRYLAGLPVMARGDQLSYRATKFVRRHRVELAAASLVGAALLAGIVVTSREAHVADRQRARAERHFASVRQLANTFMFDIDNSIRDLPGATGARALLVKTALQYLDTLSREAGPDPSLRRELAEAYAKLADIQGGVDEPNIGDSQAALSSYAKSISLFTALAAAEPADDALKARLGTVLLNHGRLLAVSGDARAAAAESRQGLALIESLARLHPQDLSAQDALATAYTSYGATLALAGDAQALDSTAKSIEILERLHALQPGDLAYELDLASAYNRAGFVSQLRGSDRVDVAIAEHKKALALAEDLLRKDPQHERRYWHVLGASQVDIGVELYDSGNPAGALDFYRQAESTMARPAADVNDWRAQFDLANVRTQLGDALVQVGRLDEAQATLSQAEAALEAVQQRGDTLSLQFVLASCQKLLGTLNERLALRPGTEREARLHYWRDARRWFAASTAGYRRVARGGITLFPLDQRYADEAAAELKRSAVEIAALEPRPALNRSTD